MFKKRGQGQSWSLDIILAFVVFVLIIGIFYALMSNNKQNKTEDLTLEANTIASNLDSANVPLGSELTIIDKGIVDNTTLTKLYSSDYDKVKRDLGIKGEFCIYLIDQNGNLVPAIIDGKQIGSFGNSNYTVSNTTCGSALS